MASAVTEYRNESEKKYAGSMASCHIGQTDGRTRSDGQGPMLNAAVR